MNRNDPYKHPNREPDYNINNYQPKLPYKEVEKPHFIPKTDWTTQINAGYWEQIKQVWDDFIDCEYEERCDALFSVIEEIITRTPAKVVSTIANCPERGTDEPGQ